MHEPQLSREDLKKFVAQLLAQRPEVITAWFGGSDANARADEWSDVDVQLIVDDENVEGAFVWFETALETLSPTELAFRIPSPTWHGHEQKFYRLARASSFSMIDFVVMARSNPDRYLEVERHGTPEIIVDREGLAVPSVHDRALQQRKIRASIEPLKVRFEMFRPLVHKCVLRGKPVEGMHFYMGFTVRPLLMVLRATYCPDRYDYGARYLHNDLPKPWPERLAHLCFVPHLEGLLERQKLAEQYFAQALEAWAKEPHAQEPASP